MSTDFDVTPFLHPDDPWVRRDGTGLVRRVYAEKYALALLLRPARVLEIGVRYGYSAAAFLAAVPAADYLGLDADEDPSRYGGEPGAPAWARAMLAARFPACRTAVLVADTRPMDRLPEGPWDLIHVDGDHSEAGTAHDLELARAARPGWILVDDVTHLPATVGRAVEGFLDRHRPRHVRLATARGDVLIQP